MTQSVKGKHTGQHKMEILSKIQFQMHLREIEY